MTDNRNQEEQHGAFPATVPVSNISTNTHQDVIHITEDKLRLIVEDYERSWRSRMEWVGPFGILVSVIISIITSEFKGAFGLTGESIKSLFVIAAIGSGAWLFISLIKSYRLRKKDSDAFIRSARGRVPRE